MDLDDEELEATRRIYNNKEYVSKKKIREKIKELKTLYNVNLNDMTEKAMTSYEMFVFVRSYIDKVKNILEELLEEN